MKTLRALAVALLAATAVPALAAPVGGAKLAAATPDAPVSFEIFLPLRNQSALDTLITNQHDENSPQYRQWLSQGDFKTRFAPAADSMARAQAAAKAAGLQITHVGSRSFHVAGTASQVGKIFNTSFKTATGPDGRTRMIAGALTMPAGLKSEGAVVFAFSGLPPKQPMVTLAKAKALATPDNRYGADGPYWYNDLKQAYDYPTYQAHLPNGQQLDGTGVHVAVLMSDLLFANDVPSYFNHEHFTTTTGKPVPAVTTELIDGGGTTGGNGSLEASLDVQQVLGGAPGASVTLISIPDLSDDSIIDGYQYIVDQNRFDIVNSSFGGCELGYTAAYNGGTDFTFILQAYEDIFKQGNAEGITFIASSGDEGALQCPSVDYFYGGTSPTWVKGVSSPADSPHVTAVGGTNLVTTSDGTLNSAYFAENGYGDPEVPYDPYGVGTNVSGGYWGPGGGVSSLFSKPLYQYLVKSGSPTFRTLPDVGMQVGGCPSLATDPCGPDRSSVITAYGVGLGGGYYGVIGTSVASPEFAGAVALFVQKVGHRVGNINTYLYALGALQTLTGGSKASPLTQYYHRNIPGFDGAYTDTFPSVNYNYIVGNGTPDVRRLFGFTNFPAAGLPQTPSNP
jgi:subtilase family serine protease